MASITPGVFFPLTCVLHPRAAPGPLLHPVPTIAVVLWPPCAGPDGEGRQSGGLHPTGAIPGPRRDAVVARQAGWQTAQSPPAVHRILHLRIRRRQTPAALAAPVTVVAASERYWRSTDISQRQFGGRSCLTRSTAMGGPSLVRGGGLPIRKRNSQPGPEGRRLPR